MHKPYYRGLIKTLAALLLIAAGIGGCGKAPVPPEVDQASSMVEELRGAGAPIYLPDEFSRLQQSVANSELRLALEKERFFLLRDFKLIYADFVTQAAEGKALLARVGEAKNTRAEKIRCGIKEWRDKVESAKALTNLMNEGRLARRSLTKSEIFIEDAEEALEKGDFDTAEIKLANVGIYHKSAEKSISKTVFRYLDQSQIERWRRTAESVVAESARSGGIALVVLKLDRKLLVYRSGKLIQTYPIGIGTNGLADKLYVGDKATPEGRYLISKKIPNSRYYKALLFNYPNEEDRRRFSSAKKRGLIPRGRGIGGNVEFHGGGPDSVTEGCISLDNNIMDRLYSISGVGTPVAIVGTLQMNDLLTSVCRKGGT